MRWIALLLVVSVGCASNRVKVSITRLHGEPVVSVEFIEKEAKNDRLRFQCRPESE